MGCCDSQPEASTGKKANMPMKRRRAPTLKLVHSESDEEEKAQVQKKVTMKLELTYISTDEDTDYTDQALSVPDAPSAEQCSNIFALLATSSGSFTHNLLKKGQTRILPKEGILEKEGKNFALKKRKVELAKGVFRLSENGKSKGSLNFHLHQVSCQKSSDDP